MPYNLKDSDLDFPLEFCIRHEMCDHPKVQRAAMHRHSVSKQDFENMITNVPNGDPATTQPKQYTVKDISDMMTNAACRSYFDFGTPDMTDADTSDISMKLVPGSPTGGTITYSLLLFKAIIEQLEPEDTFDFYKGLAPLPDDKSTNYATVCFKVLLPDGRYTYWDISIRRP